MDFPFQVGGELLPRVEEFKYLRVLLTSERKMEREMDRRIGAGSVVMRVLKHSVVVKRELSFEFTGQFTSQLSPIIMSSE